MSLLHQGIGLEHFNELPRTTAVHALFSCCPRVTWARRVVDARPYTSYEALFAACDSALEELPAQDRAEAATISRAFAAGLNGIAADQPPTTVAVAITHARIARMLGPEGGYPEYPG